MRKSANETRHRRETTSEEARPAAGSMGACGAVAGRTAEARSGISPPAYSPLRLLLYYRSPSPSHFIYPSLSVSSLLLYRYSAKLQCAFKISLRLLNSHFLAAYSPNATGSSHSGTDFFQVKLKNDVSARR